MADGKENSCQKQCLSLLRRRLLFLSQDLMINFDNDLFIIIISKVISDTSRISFTPPFLCIIYTLNFFSTSEDMYLKYIKVNNLFFCWIFLPLLHLFFWLFDQFCQQAPGHHVSGLHKTETVVESSGSACHRLLFITSPTPPTSFSNQHPLRLPSELFTPLPSKSTFFCFYYDPLFLFNEI